MRTNVLIAINTAVITTAITVFATVLLVLGFQSDRENIDLKKDKVEACRTITNETERTLCLKLV